ncbi:MAG: hypothetical protein HRU46_17040 [Verrucomicrobiales bacterium]|nr:hypothetical protein [Verrucomicrobiales bacterium]
MNDESQNINQIGAELLQEAASRPEDVLPLSTQIFPYALIASRKMSLREISSWLDEKHGVSISAMAISRALRSPDTHLARLADHISSIGNYVASATKTKLDDLLFQEIHENGPTEIDVLLHDFSFEGHSPEEREVAASVQELAAIWKPIPHKVKLLLRDYITPEESSDY